MVNRDKLPARLFFGGMTALLIGACGSPPPPAPAPEPEPIVQEEPEPEPDPGIPSRVLIDARVREPFGVQSAGQIPQRVPRTGTVVLDEGASPRAVELTVISPGPASDEVAEPEPDADSEPDSESDVTPETEAEPAPARAVPSVGRAPAPPATPAPPRPAAQRTHTVQSGETFYAIARRYNVSPMALAAANPGVDINLIRSGQVLRLPQAGNAPATGTVRTHRVQAGETLWSISRRYGVTPTQLRQANRMTDDTVRLGELLVIP